MSLSRKRRKELDHLRSSAEELWEQQQAVLNHANDVAREASRQLSHLTREEVAPRVRDSYAQYVRPGVDQARELARGTGATIERTVVPALGSAIGTVLSVGDVARDARVRAAFNRAIPQKTVVPEKKSSGIGGTIALAAAVLVAAGVAYAVWQTFRADDELWVADDESPLDGTRP
ncbi:hypothetical protein [Microterricola viridarii]|uniref:DNA helicase n=1 Tax=Microterricola viridarii TaxID=412690 RepID=A0A1H1LXR7_9MICO|nr:hypothetical protein [Microterricola viridarii]SDR79062.1 hypothetical protein SAMN04489834_0245 [Microterricola viridarii]